MTKWEDKLQPPTSLHCPDCRTLMWIISSIPSQEPQVEVVLRCEHCGREHKHSANAGLELCLLKAAHAGLRARAADRPQDREFWSGFEEKWRRLADSYRTTERLLDALSASAKCGYRASD
jgi:hypothetical protein